MHPREWAEATERLSAIFGSIGTVLLIVAITAIGAVVVLWRTLRKTEGEHTQTLISVIGGNTESNERNAAAQRDSALAVGRLGETMDRLGQSMRDTEEQRRHSLDLILQSRPAPTAPAREPVRRRKGSSRA